ARRKRPHRMATRTARSPDRRRAGSTTHRPGRTVADRGPGRPGRPVPRDPCPAIHRTHRTITHVLPDLVAHDHRRPPTPHDRPTPTHHRTTGRLQLTLRVLPHLQTPLRPHPRPLPLTKPPRTAQPQPDA